MTIHFRPCHPETILWSKDPYLHDAVSVQQARATINFIDA